MSIIIPGSPLDMMVVKFANPMPQLLFDMLVASGWRVVAFGLVFRDLGYTVCIDARLRAENSSV